MTALKRYLLIFGLMLVQASLAIVLGLTALFLFSDTQTAQHARVGALDLGGLSRQTAEQCLEEKYQKVFKEGFLKIRYNGTEIFDIRYSDIGAKLDTGTTLENVYGLKGMEKLLNLVRDSFSTQERTVAPALLLDEGKLKARLGELALLIDKEPINARIYLKEGKVVKHPEVNGLRLNIEQAAVKLKKNMLLHPEAIVELRPDTEYEIETIVPEFTAADFAGIDEILVHYTTDILSPSEVSSIRAAAAAINRVLIYAADSREGEPAGEFSFAKYIDRAGGAKEENDEGYNQVVSTLYAAVLTAGIDPGAITRTRHETPVDYIEPGLDVRVFGRSVDFKFKNTLRSNLILFAYIKEDKVNVCIAGKKPAGQALKTVETEIVQKFRPTVIHVENRALKPGEKRIITPGQEGVKVDVYLVPQGKVAINQGTKVYTDEYRPIDAMIEIGPDTEWEAPPEK